MSFVKKHFLATEKNYVSKKFGNTGLAWAFRYETLKQIKLFEMNIAGSGDYAMVLAFVHKLQNSIYRSPHVIAGTGSSWLTYANNVKNHVGPNDVTFLRESVLYSLYHGEHVDRSYVNRHDILLKHNFDSTKQLIIREGMPFKFKDDVPSVVKQELYNYFCNRKENDSILYTL